MIKQFSKKYNDPRNLDKILRDKIQKQGEDGKNVLEKYVFAILSLLLYLISFYSRPHHHVP